MGRLIAREISTVDLHLSNEGTWQNWVHQVAFNLDRSSQGLITIEIKSTENRSDAFDRDPTVCVSGAF